MGGHLGSFVSIERTGWNQKSLRDIRLKQRDVLEKQNKHLGLGGLSANPIRTSMFQSARRLWLQTGGGALGAGNPPALIPPSPTQPAASAPGVGERVGPTF